ncbi:MAG: type IX secretion system sortase PorU [Lewinellaceae bacterium]|nr:type IX secretion system sortase PorU [Lewinellaceae bacterium]
MRIRLLVLFVFSIVSLQAQETLRLQRSLVWAPQPRMVETASGMNLLVWSFDNCSRSDLAPTLPLYNERIPLSGPSTINATLSGEVFQALTGKIDDAAAIGPNIVVSAKVEQERNQYFARITFYPLRRQGGSLEKLTDFTINLDIKPVEQAATDRGGPNTFNSVLSSGSLYKFGVSGNGIYKLDYNFLKNELGLSNIDNLDPRTLKLYGNGGGMLPEQNAAYRPDDLRENAIVVVGEEDGKFNSSDYILFYAIGPAPVYYRPNATDPQLSIQKNLYDIYAWYFLKTGDGNGLRVQTQSDVAGNAYITDEFDDVQRLEEDEVNLLDFFTSAQGSGKRWFGDYFLQTRQRTYEFNFNNVVTAAPGRVKSEFAGRCGTTTTVRLTVDGTQISRNISGVSISNNETNFALGAALSGNFNPSGNKITVQINYPEVSQSSEGWLDYIELNVRRKLIMDGAMMQFRDLNSVGQPMARYRLSGANSNLLIWDVTDPQLPRRQTYTGGSTVEFGASADTLRSFAAFYQDGALPKPEKVEGAIGNQNIHELDNLHMVILYHPDFEAAAQQLAQHRRDYSGLDVAAVRIDQLYNEFSSGGKDPTAIRDFARMMLERNPGKFDYLLLLGDGSFDPKNNTGSADNLDFIPVFETAESFHTIYAYPSDDYFGLLSADEGGALDGSLDIAVGRITARSGAEAQAVVDKIIAYDRSQVTLGDWHLRLLYIGDDQDTNAHINQAEKLANGAEAKESWFNVDKVYLDAYQQVATIGDDRYPDATAAINSAVFKGSLILQYIGHGGPRGWAQERVISNNDIAQWNNANRYPLIITATCSFGGYDDYKTLTGGEQSLIKPNSGAVGLFTTVRAVYIDGNNKLTDAVQGVIFQRINGQYRSIGDILKDAKNTLSGGTEDNARRFTLLGDPAMYLALPEYRVATTKINGNPVGSGTPDTLRALMPVSLEGMVTDTMGNLVSSFNGKVTVTLFDKKQTLQTLGQDSDSPIRSFTLQRNVIFKGSATVTNGLFTIDFVVPRDIDYAFGQGKISYYAENGTHLDAAGADKSIVIGGNANIIKDDTPPLVQVFMNTDAFAFGGVTNNSPTILVKCSDDYGMNVTGVSLGHDLTAVLDGNQQNAIILNDFYESEQDNSKKGKAFYPLTNLTTGRHTLQVKGWDIANNPGEGITEFVVAEDGKIALDHVLNYPNPFTTNTQFQFEHNLSGQLLDVQISIFSVSGKLVKTILHSAAADGFRVTDIAWDGHDEYGDQLAKGVYLYKVKVRGTDVSGSAATAESGFEKLVILK